MKQGIHDPLRYHRCSHTPLAGPNMLQLIFAQWFSLIRQSHNTLVAFPDACRRWLHSFAQAVATFSAPGEALALTDSGQDDFKIFSVALYTFGGILFLAGFLCGRWHTQATGGGVPAHQLAAPATTSAGLSRASTPPSRIRSLSTPSPLRPRLQPLPQDMVRRLEFPVPLIDRRAAPEAERQGEHLG